MDAPQKKNHPRMVAALMETFGLSLWAAIAVALLAAALCAAALVWIFLSAPPRVVTVTSGPENSTFARHAERYKAGLARRGVELQILPSGGSVENLQRLRSKDGSVDFGFVQGGLTEGFTPPNLISLGSISYQPLWLFHRGATPISRLSELAGKRIAVGASGSGTRALAVTLLLANGIGADRATLVDDDAEKAASGLQEGRLDAVFLMGDSAPLQVLRTLIRTDGIQMFDFKQADAYVRRYPYLNKMVLPQGSFDLGKNLPDRDVTLICPMVELVARRDLHPALSDILLEVAHEVHGRAGLFQRQGQFPAPLKHEFEISAEAARYYKSGLGTVYKLVHSYWLASVINRALVALVPIILILVPAVRLLPLLYRWQIQTRIYRSYRPLLALEREASGSITREKSHELLQELDAIEQKVNRIKVPAFFADQFYELRLHIMFVRRRIRLAAMN